MNKSSHISPDWTTKVTNPAQIGGIETSVLDNGAGRGNRIAWINTGSGLRFKVMLDRGMDIAEAFFNQHNLAWLSKAGFSTPQLFPDKGIDWLRTFGGGLLTTCGLTHVGGPETDEYGTRGLHGLISNTPAELIAMEQPDLIAGNYEMKLKGRMRESTIFGPHLELTRTISSTLGSSGFKILDEVTNIGNTPSPLMLLYHFNMGYPLLDEGSTLQWEGDWKPRVPEKASIFKEGNDFKTITAPISDHLGTGEEVVLIDPHQDKEGYCVASIKNERLDLQLTLKFKKSQLPKLCNWLHLGDGEYVAGIEPGTHWPIGQKTAREQGELIFLAPKEKRTFEIEININNPKENSI